MKDIYKNIDEMKLLRKSKLYIDALAQGINPFTGEYTNDSILSEEKLKNCFDYVSYVLGEVIEKGGLKNVRRKKIGTFVLTKEESEKIKYSVEPIGINNVAAMINEVIDLDKSDKITGMQLSGMLLEMGYLSQVPGTKQKCINERSAELGINTVNRVALNGSEYTQILYGIDAQKFIVSKLIENK